jgi:hypothetical protein
MQKNLLFTLLVILSVFTNSFGQNETYKHTVSASAGLNLFQIIGLVDKIDDGTNAINLDTKGTASYGITYDYGINKWFSLGVGGAFAKFRLSADQITIVRNDGSTYQGPVDLKLSRTTISIRPLFHYGNAKKLDLYSGLRLGVNLYNVNVKANEALDPTDVTPRAKASKLRPNIQIIPFALRGYLSENFAIGFETGLGAPHYLALQLSYRM